MTIDEYWKKRYGPHSIAPADVKDISPGGALVDANESGLAILIAEAKKAGVEGEWIRYKHFGWRYLNSKEIHAPQREFWYGVVIPSGENGLLD